jgi:Chaperone of endosialidase
MADDEPQPFAGELVTANYGWTKPTVGASTDAWGGYINADLDGIDSVVHGMLPLAGGVMTGPIHSVTGDTIDGAAGTARSLFGRTGTSNRWEMQLGGSVAESGSNLGSNFNLVAYSDAGIVVGTTLSISRAAAFAYLNGVGASPNVESPSGGHSTIRMNNAGSGSVSALQGSVNGKARWEIQVGDPTTESGGNSGSNFSLYRFTDGGTGIDVPIGIARSTGVVTFSATPVAPTPAPGTNSGVMATTAFVTAALPVASTTAPLMNGTAAVGASGKWADGAHVHPSDTSKLSLTGGTLTGPLSGTSVSMSAGVVASGTIQSNGGNVSSQAAGAGNANFQMLNNAGGTLGYLFYNVATSGLELLNSAAGNQTALLRSDGYFVVSVGGAQPGGGSWANSSSDLRTKTVQGDYAAGLAEVLQLQPIVYTYKGNDTPSADLGRSGPEGVAAYSGAAPYPGSLHYQAAIDQTPFVGFVAQDIEAIVPDMVAARAGFIDGAAVSDLRTINVSNLVYALVNAVKTLAARIEALEAAR